MFPLQFDGEPGEIAKDACAEFCKNQKLALEQLKVCNLANEAKKREREMILAINWTILSNCLL